MTRHFPISMSVLFLLACGGEAANAPAAAATTPGTAPQYQIVLNRPLVAGARFRVQVEAREQIEGVESHSSGDHAAVNNSNEDIKLSLVGRVTVREVDQDGRATSALLEVESFSASPEGTAALPAGTPIDFVRGEGKFTVMVNGSPRPELMKQLNLAFPLQRPGSPLGDALFGTKDPKQVGDTWPFSKSLVAKSMLEDGYKVRETELSGETRLNGITSVGGVECLELNAKLTADQSTLGEQWGLTGVGTGKLESTIKMVVPTNTALPLAMEEATTHGEFQAHVQDDASAAHSSITLSRYRRALYTQMK